MGFEDVTRCECGRVATKRSGYKWCFICEKKHASPGRPPGNFKRTKKADIFELIEAEKEKLKGAGLLDITGDVETLTAILSEFKGKTIDEGLTETLLQTIWQMTERRAALVEKYYKIENTKADTFTKNQMGVFVSYVSVILNGEIEDKELLERIARKLRKVPFEAICRGDVIEGEIVPDELPPTQEGVA